MPATPGSVEPAAETPSPFHAYPASLPCGVWRADHEILPATLSTVARELLELAPPADLAPVHSARHLASFAQHLQQLIDRPVRRAAGAGGVFHAILGVACYHRRWDGTFATATWAACPSGARPGLEEFRPADAPIVDFPRTPLWHTMLQKALAAEAWSRIGGGDPALRWAQWAWSVLHERLIRPIDVRRLRSRIRAGLQLDPRTLSLLRLVGRKQGAATPSVLDYNRVRGDIRALSELRRLSPLMALLWFHATEPEDLLAKEPARRLKEICAGLGVKPAQWRLLAHRRARLLPAWRVFRTEFAGNNDDAAADFIRMVALLEPTRAHDPDLWRSVLSMVGTRVRPPESYAGELHGLGKALRHVVQLIERRGATADLERRRDELHDICAWILDCDIQRLDSRQRRGGWPYLARRARKYALERRRLLEVDSVRWPAPCHPVALDGFTALPLACGRDLWEESVAMRHCADQLAGPCRQGRLAVFSIRRADGTRYATLALELRDGAWQLRQVSRRANRKAGNELAALVALTAGVMNALPPARADGGCVCVPPSGSAER